MIGVDVVIDQRFNGPPDSGHGGYSAGRAAALVEPSPDGAVEVTLRRPVPLATPLSVAEDEGGAVALWSGGELIMEARPVPGVAPADPPLVGLGAARAAVDPDRWLDGHPFPTCFGCGPDRDPADAMRLFAGDARRRPLRGALDARHVGGRRRRRRAGIRLGGDGLPELRARVQQRSRSSWAG